MSESYCYLFAALPCEAKPLISYFKLKKELSIHAFTVYRNDSITLTVSGVGKSAMAAAVAYTLALFPAPSVAVLLNIGIAGHRTNELGTVFSAEKIVDQDSGRVYYPQLVVTPPCSSQTMTTVSSAQLDYGLATLYDMEASAFYETASRFVSSELIQCIKVISDNQNNPATQIKPAQASQLISDAIPIIDDYRRQLSQLALLNQSLSIRYYAEITEKWHFTHHEKMQLTRLLSKRAVLTNDKALNLAEMLHLSAKALLNDLQQDIDIQAFGGFKR